MKRLFGAGIIAGLAIVAAAVWTPRETGQSDAAEVQMRAYYVGLLKRGPAWTSEQTPEVVEVSQAHRENIDELVASGKMVLAGPFMSGTGTGEGALTGLFIYDVETKAEAEQLAAADPAVAAGRFTIDVLMWYGPRGITYDGRE